MNATALELLAYSSLYSALMLSSWSNGSRFNIVRLKICSTSRIAKGSDRMKQHEANKLLHGFK